MLVTDLVGASISRTNDNSSTSSTVGDGYLVPVWLFTAYRLLYAAEVDRRNDLIRLVT